MATTDELLDNLMKDYKKPEDLIGENGLLKQLTKRLLERAMQAEPQSILVTRNMLHKARTLATPVMVVTRKTSRENLVTSK